MSNNNVTEHSTYSFDLARMSESVQGHDSQEVVTLKRPMSAAEIQAQLEQAYYAIYAQEG